MHSTKRVIRITNSSDGHVTETSSEITTLRAHSPNLDHNSEKMEKGPNNVSLLQILNKNRKDKRINVPEQGGLGAIASRAKLVNRGGVGQVDSYQSLKKDLLAKGTLYEDPDFKANNESIYFSSNKGGNFQWKRPQEICNDPQFFVGGASRFDVCQGELGDCWLLAAVSSLSMQSLLLGQVVPSDQSFEKGNYTGAFHFSFWHYGEWKEVIIDDRLPTRNNKLVFMHSRDLNEFWSALLEKAYAKLYGSYELLKGGSSSEAMEDFTGGITEIIDLKEDNRKNVDSKEKLFQIMQQAQTKLSLMGCSIEANPKVTEARLNNGLIMGHAYSVTAVKQINAKVPGYHGDIIKLVRIRNPWGQSEWTGEWADSSSSWNQISTSERGLLGLNFENDGEFWMSFNDFVNNFEKLEICHLGPQSIGESLLKSSSKRTWESSNHQGNWMKGVSAGGCLNFQETFWSNPQYKIVVTDPDKDDTDSLGTLIVGLLQKNMRSIKNRGNELHAIGYVIYKLPSTECAPLDKAFFRTNRKVAMSPSFVNMREVCGRHRLPPGAYAIIPSTFESNQEADFLLRIFSERSSCGKELDHTSKMEDKNIALPLPVNESEINMLREAFRAIAGDDLEVDAGELKDILDAAFRKEKFFRAFTIDTCRSMVAMMDTDLSGRLGFDEFQIMWLDLKLWKTVFKKEDIDGSGSLSSYELRILLKSIGFNVSNKIFSNLVVRFATKTGLIEFDDFIHCCVRLKTVFQTFKAQKKDINNNAIIDQDTFIQSTIYS